MFFSFNGHSIIVAAWVFHLAVCKKEYKNQATTKDYRPFS
jgi:hypothetical protein